MTTKKEKWVCPLCLGYDHPPNQTKIEQYEAMDRLYQAIENLYLHLYYKHLPEDED